MKVLVASMTAESNMLNPDQEQLDEFEIFYGQDMIERMYSQDLFEEAGIKLIPTIYASGGARLCGEATLLNLFWTKFSPEFENIRTSWTASLCFFMGPAMWWIWRGRSGTLPPGARTGNRRPEPAGTIAVHGSPRQRESAAHRTCKHRSVLPGNRLISTGWNPTHQAKMLDLLKRPREIHPVYVRVPILIGGERCVSAEEPLCSINRKLDQCEKIPGILSASYRM